MQAIYLSIQSYILKNKSKEFNLIIADQMYYETKETFKYIA